MKTLAEKKAEEEAKEKEDDKIWDVWEDDTIVAWKPRRMPKPITAPKRELPSHAESFNPAEEYLFDAEEKEQWQKQDPEDRRLNFIPEKIEALRKVPLYQNLIKEHFERCLDLYLCPRLLRKKVNVKDPTKLIPELPSPNDLKPFPSVLSVEYHFHKKSVRTMAVSPNGLYLATGDEDHNLVIWHTRTAKVMRHYTLPNKVVDSVQWNPDPTLCLLIATNEEHVLVITPDLYARKVNEATRALLQQTKEFYDSDLASVGREIKEANVKWVFAKDMKKD